MNNQEAQLILNAYRPGGPDAGDPLVSEALEQARRDPELQKWFAEEQALDFRIQTKLRAALVTPPELKANLLALQKMSRPVSLWRRQIWLAAAAAVVLLLGLAGLWLRQENAAQLDSFRKTMVAYSMTERGHIAFENPDLTKIQQWLRDQGVKSEIELPAGLRGKPAEGCRVVDWNGHRVSLICFVLPNGDHLDLFVMERAGLRGVADSGAPQFVQSGALMTATWTNGSQVYMLTGDNDKRLLQKLLRQT